LGHRTLLVLQPARRMGRPGSASLERAVAEAELPMKVHTLPFAVDEHAQGVHPEDVVSMLSDAEGPTFVHVNEAQAPALLKVLRDAQMSIPDDVSFMTTGAPTWAEIVQPPLSVTDVDYSDCGRKPAECILALRDGPKPRRRVVKSRYIRRESVG